MQKELESYSCPTAYCFFESAWHENNEDTSSKLIRRCFILVPLDIYNELIDAFRLISGLNSRFVKFEGHKKSSIGEILSRSLGSMYHYDDDLGRYFKVMTISRIALSSIWTISSDGIKRCITLDQIGPYFPDILRFGHIGAKSICDESIILGQVLPQIKLGLWYIRTWTILIHNAFPKRVRDIVKTMILLRQRSMMFLDRLKRKPKYDETIYCLLRQLPVEMLHFMFSFLRW